MAKPPSPHDFTVGWVCALPVELAAAAEMMDKEFADHPSHPSHPTDSNLYSFGRVGVHNVVVACLPAGQMGTNQAATVASQMRLSFPSLRFGILVGIGGGVPRLDDNIDIRLGDVVISQPHGPHSGVVQYDFGKTGTDGRIARTGSLNAPPTILLNALAKLHANDLRGRTQVLTHLAKLSSQPKFALPGPDHDTLYDASSAHVSGATCARCRPEDVLDREPRATTDPVLFFGTIASGNQVMRDGPTRDRYSQALGGVLCFEMEAAGLMNNLPCLVVRGICDYADAHKNKQWQPYAAATAAAYTKELLSIVPPVVDWDKHETSRPKRHFIVPFDQNESFVGREDTLNKLLARLPPAVHPNTCQRTVIEGLGGIGKTQVAIEVAYRVRKEYPDCSVFWVPAVDMAMFENAYREIGRALGVTGVEEDKADTKVLVMKALEREEAGNWLLIIDNADDMLLLTDGQLMSSLPSSRAGSILLTTRNHQVTAGFDARQGVFELGRLSDSASVQLLHQGLRSSQMSDPQSTTDLLDYLVYLPLAIRQASAYMALQMSVTVAKYLEYCKSSDQKMVKMLSNHFNDRDRYKETGNAIATTWLISFKQIERDAPLATRYLRSIAYFAEKDIPASLLPPGTDEIARDEAISTLQAYAFIVNRGTPDRFDVHRLVGLAMRNWLQIEQKESKQVTDVLRHLVKEFPWPTHANRDQWGSYLPHAQAVLGFKDECTEKNALLPLQHSVAEGHYLLGKYAEAERMHRQTLELRKTALGPDHPSTLGSMNNLANVLWQQGKYAEAERMHRQTLELRKTALGPDHPSTLGSMNNLAEVLRQQGKYAEAERMHRQTLELTKTALGPDHPSTLGSMNNLANVLWQQGKYAEAETIHRQTLELRKTALSPDHPSTLDSMNNLAEVLRQQGKYAEAERMHRQTLELTKTALGPDHPSTLDSMNNLAIVLRQQGKYAEAERMHRQTLELTKTALGPDHPSTLDSMNNLANVLWQQGKYAEAETIHRQTLELRKTALSPDHPSTLGSMNNLANVLWQQGKYAEAERMHRQTLELRKTALGPDHPSTLGSMNNLAEVLRQQGKYAEAERMHRQTLELRKTALSPDHPSTLDSMNNLAIVLEQQRKYTEAETMHGQKLAWKDGGRLREAEDERGEEAVTSVDNCAAPKKSQSNGRREPPDDQAEPESKRQCIR